MWVAFIVCFIPLLYHINCIANYCINAFPKYLFLNLSQMQSYKIEIEKYNTCILLQRKNFQKKISFAFLNVSLNNFAHTHPPANKTVGNRIKVVCNWLCISKCMNESCSESHPVPVSVFVTWNMEFAKDASVCRCSRAERRTKAHYFTSSSK